MRHVLLIDKNIHVLVIYCNIPTVISDSSNLITNWFINDVPKTCLFPSFYLPDEHTTLPRSSTTTTTTAAAAAGNAGLTERRGNQNENSKLSNTNVGFTKNNVEF